MSTTSAARVRVYLDPADWWIGCYLGPHHLYLCPLPTLVIRVRRHADPTPHNPPRRAA